MGIMRHRLCSFKVVWYEQLAVNLTCGDSAILRGLGQEVASWGSSFGSPALAGFSS